jgi:FIMAH domain-containing protein
VLDCGHFVDTHGHTCFDDDPANDPDFVSSHQNQEIHPIYSIDIINFPFRPEDILKDARKNLTGAWGGSDGSTYYVRQIGNTIWWLGQMRDRQPMQRGANFPIIGALQLKSAFDAGDPPCPSQQCWAFATVFKGTITESPIQTVIEGDWAGVPQSKSAGSSGGHMRFFVFNHKIIVGATPSIFPVTIEKMYEPEDTTPPVITINQPAATQYPHNATLTLNYSLTDGVGAGVHSFTPLMDNATTVGNHGLQSGQAINLLTETNLGQHTFTVNAIDNAGNEDSSSVTFTIVVTADSIKDDVNQFVATGSIRNHGLANSLLAKLNAAESARAAGDCATANNNYQAFITKLQVEIGKGVDAAAAVIMIADAQYLIAHCL